MKAIILAAGIASRLRPLTNLTPKCLLKIGERCLLARTFDALIANNIHNFVVVTGYREEQIIQFLKDNYGSVSIQFITNNYYDSTNNIYSLWLTKPYAKGEDILLLDSDILFDSNIVKMLLQSAAPTALALNRHPLSEEEIKVIADANLQVVEISKTCSVEKAMGESIGIEKMGVNYTQALFEELDTMIEKEKLVNVFYEQAFERLAQQGKSFKVIDTSAFFSMEMDTVEDYEHAQQIIPKELY